MQTQISRESGVALDLYDSSGRPYAYSDDGEHIYTFDGRPIAYLNGDSVYSYQGKHLAYIDDGIIWDSSGAAMLFTADARGGPVKPVRQGRPVKGVRHVRPIKGARDVRPVRPVKSLRWSRFPPDAIFE